MTPSSSLAPVSSTVDAVESWIAGQSFWIQVPILLAVLVPLTYLVAGLIDKVVDRLLWPYTRREARKGARHPAGRALTSTEAPAPASTITHSGEGSG